ncbi:MAG: ABC-type sugar transport system, periplasmic component, partial [Mesotoga infera]
EMQKMRAVEGSFNPTIEALYADYEVLEANPFFGSLYSVFTNAVARPSTATAPRYNEVSTLFFKTVHSILSGTADAQNALEELALDLEDLTGFEVVWGNSRAFQKSSWIESPAYQRDFFRWWSSGDSPHFDSPHERLRTKG